MYAAVRTLPQARLNYAASVKGLLADGNITVGSLFACLILQAINLYSRRFMPACAIIITDICKSLPDTVFGRSTGKNTSARQAQRLIAYRSASSAHITGHQLLRSAPGFAVIRRLQQPRLPIGNLLALLVKQQQSSVRARKKHRIPVCRRPVHQQLWLTPACIRASADVDPHVAFSLVRTAEPTAQQAAVGQRQYC